MYLLFTDDNLGTQVQDTMGGIILDESDDEDNKSLEFELELINLIKAQRCLYDKTDANYIKKTYKTRIWKSIAQKLSKTIEGCQKKWTYLRAQYSRKKKDTLQRPSGSGYDDLEDQWKYMEHLDFLAPFVEPRKTVSNDFENITVSNESTSPPNSDIMPVKSSRKRRRSAEESDMEFQSILKKLNQKIDNIDDDSTESNEMNFVKTLIGMVSHCSTADKDEYKLKLMEITIEFRRTHPPPN